MCEVKIENSTEEKVYRDNFYFLEDQVDGYQTEDTFNAFFVPYCYKVEFQRQFSDSYISKPINAPLI